MNLQSLIFAARRLLFFRRLSLLRAFPCRFFLRPLILFAVLSAPLSPAFAAEKRPSLWTDGEAVLSCQNLKDGFAEYQGDIDLTYTAFAKSLINLSKALRDVLKEPAGEPRDVLLLNIIQETEKAVSVSYSDQDTISGKGFDIQDALEECLVQP